MLDYTTATTLDLINSDLISKSGSDDSDDVAHTQNPGKQVVLGLEGLSIDSAASVSADETASGDPPPADLISTSNDTSNSGGSISNDKGKVCYGIVKEEDFESMVPATWWKQVFGDCFYLATDGDVVEDPEITKEELRILESNSVISSLFKQGLPSSSPSTTAGSTPKILDLCCGQGRHALMLAERYPLLQLYGHDQSEYLIALATERASHLSDATTGNRPKFTIGDCRSTPYANDEMDFVMIMGNSFGYFSSSDEDPESVGNAKVYDGDTQVLHEVNRVLKVGGHLVLDLADGDYLRQSFSPRSWEWIDDETFVCRERTLSADQKRLHSREVIVGVHKGVVRDQFYSERLYGREELTSMMENAGFNVQLLDLADGNVNSGALDKDSAKGGSTGDLEGTITAARELSQRGQDLGMMEQRILMFACKIQSKVF